MRKLCMLFGCMLMLCGFSSPLSISVNGETVSFGDAQPVVEDGRLLVPVRDLFELMKYDITWTSENESVTLVSRIDSSMLVMCADSPVLKYRPDDSSEWVEIELEVCARVVDERMMVPMSAVCTATGYEVKFSNGEIKVVQ